jgi:phosphoglycolate phosphatase
MDEKPRGLAIFDLDGTLFRAETATVPAIRRAFQEMGLPEPDRRVILSFFGKPTGEYHAWLRAQCRPDQGDYVVAQVDRLELEYAVEQGELYPGIRQALVEIRALAVHMALCSNGPPPYVERILAAHGLAPFFGRVRCWQADGDNKMTMIGELLDAVRTRPAMVIGDRGDDVEAAHRHGATAIAVTYGYGSTQEFLKADRVVTSARALPGVIRGLLG